MLLPPLGRHYVPGLHRRPWRDCTVQAPFGGPAPLCCWPAGELNFNIVGVAFQLTSIFSESIRLVLVQILLQVGGWVVKGGSNGVCVCVCVAALQQSSRDLYSCIGAAPRCLRSLH